MDIYYWKILSVKVDCETQMDRSIFAVNIQFINFFIAELLIAFYLSLIVCN